MGFVRYVLSCIVSCFDALVGKSNDSGIKEYLIGLTSLFIIITLFFVSFFITNKVSKLSYRTNIICAIALTVLLLIIVSVMIIIVEKIFC